ncbi:hypothetical protein [Arthrobacter mangrovi]|uniref:DUF1918 domain-containing protein n=1 Tax=Arthrobacter mangrovi TaxID=2966350 RepID=A0ABQ5MTB5_9MICC|nr:hypothetical protein [Arthrobacter mangrovi]GLB67204.1 hypothetical protein AHIS1636_16430 [Arthrobacter mangrovi]
MSKQSALVPDRQNVQERPGRLYPGDPVAIEHPRRVKETGVVDDVTEDGRTIWVYLDHGRGRRMYLEDDGYRFSLRNCPVPSW